MSTPIDRLIDNSGLRCTICGAPKGECGCFETCRCGWSYPRGGECANPVHHAEAAAHQLAEDVASRVVQQMRRIHPMPMKYASGGFRKSLQNVLQREAQAAFLSFLTDLDQDNGCGAAPAAELVTVRLITYLEQMYPVPLAHADGAFLVDLREVCRRNIADDLAIIASAVEHARACR